MAFTFGEWQSWVCQFLGVPLPSMLALCANNRKCPCHRPYDPHADHVNTCIHCKHLSIQAHNHFQDSLVSLARDAGCVGVNTNRVPTIAVAQDQHFRADIYIPQMLLVACRGVCLDASRVHDFRGSADNPSQNGTLRHSDINALCSQSKAFLDDDVSE